MPSPEPFLLFTRAFEELGVRYMVSGSLAAMFYGEPRLTNDVDIVAFLRGSDALRIERALGAGQNSEKQPVALYLFALDYV